MELKYNDSSMGYTADESKVATFVGDYFSSDSFSFHGFPDNECQDKVLMKPGDKNNVTLQQGYFKGEIAENNSKKSLNNSPEVTFVLSGNGEIPEVFSAHDTGINKYVNRPISPKSVYPYPYLSPSSDDGSNSVCFKFDRNKVHQVYASTEKRRLSNGKMDTFENKDVTKVKGPLDFSYNFNMVEGITGCVASLETPEIVFENENSHLVAPQSRSKVNVNTLHDNTNEIQFKYPENQTGKLTSTPLDTVQRQETDTIPKTVNTTTNPCRDMTESQTPKTNDIQTENTNLSTDVLNILYSIQKGMATIKEDVKEEIHANFNTLEDKMDKKLTNMDTNYMNTINTMDTRLTNFENKIDVKNDVLDGMNMKLTDLGTGLDHFRHEVNVLKTKIDQNEQQVELLNTKVLQNTNQIFEINQGNKQLETKVTEIITESHLTLNANYVTFKGEVKEEIGNMAIDLQQARNDLQVLKNSILKLGGSIDENRVQGDQLNVMFRGLKQNMLPGMPNNQEIVDPMLSQAMSWSSTTPMQAKHNERATANGFSHIPSISSSPLVAQSQNIPQATINQAYQTQYSPKYLTEEDAMMKAIMKREKTPCFDGVNISAPQFIEETEAYFRTVNITTDSNKIKIVGSFFQNVAFLWWRRVEKEIMTWNQAKKEIMEQYFNDYNKQKFKQEWREYIYDKIKDVEMFALGAFHLLDIVKPHYSFKKKCQSVASRLPAPLMNYLLQKDFCNEKDFMNLLKEAMILTNFNPNDRTNGSQNRSQNSGYASSQNSNTGWMNTTSANSNGIVITNPNYKGSPANFNPNYRPFNRSGYSNNNNNYRQPRQGNNNYGNQRQGNGSSGNHNNHRRVWHNRNNQRNGQRPYTNYQQNISNTQQNNGNGSSPPQGVNNINMGPGINTPTATQGSQTPQTNSQGSNAVIQPGYMLIPSTSPIFQTIMDATANASTSSATDGQNNTDSDSTNY